MMTAASTAQDVQEHFAHCVQIMGGTTAFARRLRIDERAIRRFINGEKPVSDGLLDDIAKALRLLSADAIAAEHHIATVLRSGSNDARSSDAADSA